MKKRLNSSVINPAGGKSSSGATVHTDRRCLKRGDVDLEDLLSLLDWAVGSRRLAVTVPA